MPGESIQTLQEQPSTTVDLSTAADNVKLLIVNQPITVINIGMLVVAATTVTAFVADFHRRVTAGSDTGRITQGVGRLTSPVAAVAAGRYVEKAVQVDLNPGDEVSVQVTTAASAGTGIPYCQYIARGASPTDFSKRLVST